MQENFVKFSSAITEEELLKDNKSLESELAEIKLKYWQALKVRDELIRRAAPSSGLLKRKRA
jgi:hypothetical protein